MVKKGRGLLKRKRGDGGSEIRRRLAILVLSEERERERVIVWHFKAYRCIK